MDIKAEDEWRESSISKLGDIMKPGFIQALIRVFDLAMGRTIHTIVELVVTRAAEADVCKSDLGKQISNALRIPVDVKEKAVARRVDIPRGEVGSSCGGR